MTYDDFQSRIEDFEYEKQNYSLSEIARIMQRPRTTLKEWADLFKEYLPTVGSGRAMRYKKEAIELFMLIAKMKDANETNQQIRDQLSKFATEIVYVEREEKPEVPYVVDVLQAVKQIATRYGDLTAKYVDLSEDVDEIKRIMAEMSDRLQKISDEKVTDRMEELQKKVSEKLAAIEEVAKEQQEAIKDQREALFQENEHLKKELEEMKRGQEELLKKQEMFMEQQKEWSSVTKEEIQAFMRNLKERESRGFWSKLFKK